MWNKNNEANPILPEQQSQYKNKATHQYFLEFCSLKFQESCRKSSMRQQAVPLGRVAECEWVHRANMAVADRRTESAPHSSGVNHPLYPPRTHTDTHTHTHTGTHTQANIQKVCQKNKQINILVESFWLKSSLFYSFKVSKSEEHLIANVC